MTLGPLDHWTPVILGPSDAGILMLSGLFVSKGAWTVSKALVVDVAPVPYTSLLEAVPY